MKYVVGNWKMYTTVPEAVAYFGKLEDGLRDQVHGGRDLPTVIVAPPFISLSPLQDIADDRIARFAAQNCHWEELGEYTGEISPAMLDGLADYVLIGHSERRDMGETDEIIAKKVVAAAEAGLTPILFVGEENPADIATHHTEQELTRGVSLVDLKEHNVIVAYEPLWTIGADEPADSDHIGGVARHLKEKLRDFGAESPTVLYGGGVTSQTVDHVADIDDIDGLVVSRASLEYAEFLKIVDKLGQAS